MLVTGEETHRGWTAVLIVVVLGHLHLARPQQLAGGPLPKYLVLDPCPEVPALQGRWDPRPSPLPMPALVRD